VNRVLQKEKVRDMTDLAQLKNTSRPRKKVQRIGRGVGSKRGRTACRGQKGDGARGGYTRRYGYEGGQVPLYRKLPVRGFTRGRFVKPSIALTLAQLEHVYKDGEIVNAHTLREKGLIPRIVTGGIKILSTGTLTKGVQVEVHAVSAEARRKLESAKIPLNLIESNV
jgi:large subunit ribosomal protein L15